LTCFLALDTGATNTVISAAAITQLGYDLTASTGQHQILTASGVVSVPQMIVVKITALGKTRTDFPIMAHNLPPSASVDGVLGLDFLRGYILHIDFQQGTIDLL
jgi:aspartyl protease family protein